MLLSHLGWKPSLQADSKGHGEKKPEHLVGLQDKPDTKDKD